MLEYDLDLTPYCWTLTRPRPDRVRLMLHMAPVPGNARELALRLRNRGLTGVRLHSRSSLFVDRPATIAALARALGATALVQAALEDWAGTWVGRPGVRLPPEIHARRKRAVEEVLQLLGARR